MKYQTIALIVIIGIGIPFVGNSQSFDLEKILAQAFTYEPLKSFLTSPKNDGIYLSGILSNNQIPSGTKVMVFGEEVVVRPGSEPEPYTILLKKMRIKPERAKLKFIYHSNLKARMSLKFEHGRWEVHRSFIRMRSLDSDGKKTKKMHWDF